MKITKKELKKLGYTDDILTLNVSDINDPLAKQRRIISRIVMLEEIIYRIAKIPFPNFVEVPSYDYICTHQNPIGKLNYANVFENKKLKNSIIVGHKEDNKEDVTIEFKIIDK